MIISLDSENKMNSTCSISRVHTPAQNVNMYGGAYVLDWHAGQHVPVNVKQEVEDAAYNNDSGVSPSHFSDHSNHNNTSPLSYRSEGQQSSLDSGNPDKTFRPSPSHEQSPDGKDGSVQTNATIGILARPILTMSPPQQSASPDMSRSPEEKQLDDSRSSTSDAEGSVYEDDPLRRLQMALQKTGIMGPMSQPESLNGEKPLQCPLCEYATVLRSDFNAHLMTHSNQVNCSQCDFTADNTDKLRDHLQDVHNTTMEDEAIRWADEEEPGVTTPKINSQGKVKTYRCKQCDYTAVTKLDFWDHSRQHIKTERLLTCPKCPFVTEYKHHLEYHLRNHFGSKPFKCDKCPYTCVNKSMLNSHLKSHSTVYQFRCANCTYATKYCHSLKLHLRKYNHTPAMVLNPDGTPNPLPIVDIYGTRRGPKTKTGKCDDIPSSPPSQLHSGPPVFPSPFAFMPNPTLPYPINAMMNSFPTVNPMYPNHSPPLTDEHIDVEHSVFNVNNNKESVKDYFTRIMTMQQEIIARTQHTIEDVTRAPLDLSRSDPQSSHVEQTATKNRRKGKAFKLERISQQLQQSDEENIEQTPKRQKHDFESEQNHQQEVFEKPTSPEGLPLRVPSPPVKSPSPKPSPLPPTEAELPSTVINPEIPKVNFCEPKNNEFKSTISSERKERWKNVKEIYDCSYCDLLFGDVVMYTMHMGYHGYQNPFTCNMCGEETADRVQFFLHLFRFNHG